ncbi:macro domain-containing protein [Streptomyces millisiae]|uniref:Appr-1-p processing protein n=1 Tax=Streptomyces millisiae TaxID=3075542 RepID=A0ABU2LPI5_9ACTN|nr:Appr-1-p processing protein [Streptomyces sp. DSM 44918]MDT0318973.1 Appr-1-p processing protein [Streptomyces sp. DSM 44918]
MGADIAASSPSHAELLADLRSLRRPGLTGLRTVPVPALRRAALSCGFCADSDDVPAGVEALLRQAVQRLGERDALGLAAARSFGLVPGGRGAAAQDRRKAAALVYGVSTETFRKRQEGQVLDQLAEAVLALCRETARRPAGPAGDVAATAPGATPPRVDPAPPTRIETTVADAPAPFVLHVSPVDLLRNIDILVSSENVYLEMARTFGPTLSGALRRAGAVRDAAGQLVDDVLADELAAWVREHGRPGLPVRPGTVAATSSGAMRAHGIRRIYHAAVAVPFADRDGYEVAPGDIARAVREAFALARAEREAFDPPLSSICFPLMGAGRARLAPEVSASWIGWAVHEELLRDPDWTVHMVVKNRATAEAIADLGRPRPGGH